VKCYVMPFRRVRELRLRGKKGKCSKWLVYALALKVFFFIFLIRVVYFSVSCTGWALGVGMGTSASQL